MTLHLEERIVSEGIDHFATVRHLLLRGSNYEIGQSLAKLARERYRSGQGNDADPLRQRARRLYFQRNYPQHYERGRGVAAAYGWSWEDERHEALSLNYPPQAMRSGHATLSRNYDFSTGSIAELIAGIPGMPPFPEDVTLAPFMSEPYIMEMYPDTGYPSLFVSSNDLLGSCFDGINSEGLTVALLANYGFQSAFAADPALQPQVGLNEAQVPRMLLETCATAEEARMALLQHKQYYTGVPLHYIIGDRSGDAFVWEYSPGHNNEYILDIHKDAHPLLLTNHPLSLEESSNVQNGEDSLYSVARLRLLREQIAVFDHKKSIEDVKQISACTFFAGERQFNVPFIEGGSPTRTLWHSIYDSQERSMDISFFVRDQADPMQPEHQVSLRTEYYRFTLRG